MRAVTVALALALMASPSVAEVDPDSGMALGNHCADDGPEAFGGVFCLGFIDAAGDFAEACPSGVTTLGQTVAVVRKYLADHPERLHERASYLVVEAIEGAWPCP